MEWVESTGKTIDAAKDVALDRLGVHEDDAEFDIVADTKFGLFGRVKEEARVRARVRPATPRAKEDRNRRQRGGRSRRGGRDGPKRRGGTREQSSDRGSGRGGAGSDERDRGRSQSNRSGRSQGGRGRSRTSSDETSAAPSDTAGRSRDNDGGSRRGNGGARRSESRSGSGRQSREKPVNEDEPMMPLSEQADIAQEFVAGLAERFGAKVSFERADVEDDIHLTVTGADLGRMIGRRGSTAMAIDELVRTVLQRQAGSSRNGRIRVDIGGVRARRTEALTQFCLNLAEQVRASGVAKALEPMSAADRKVVHDVITDEAGVDTVSEGEDPHRRVVIVPVGDAD